MGRAAHLFQVVAVVGQQGLQRELRGLQLGGHGLGFGFFLSLITNGHIVSAHLQVFVMNLCGVNTLLQSPSLCLCRLKASYYQ